MRYSVNPSTKPMDIPSDASSIHLVRPVKEKMLAELVEKHGLMEISLSASCRKRLSGKARKFIMKKGIVLREEENRGRPTAIGLEKIREIIELHREDLSYREIEDKLSIPKSTAHYLIRYAERNKIRKGKAIIYLE